MIVGTELVLADGMKLVLVGAEPGLPAATSAIVAFGDGRRRKAKAA